MGKDKKDKKVKKEKKEKKDKKRKAEKSDGERSAKKARTSSSDSSAAGAVAGAGASSGVVPVKLSVISKPLAGEKLCKKLLKLCKKAAKAKHLKRGVKEVVKSIRKGEKGLCVIAGDISPIDVISHLAPLCESKELAYIYVPSKAELGAASATKRPTSCVLITETEKGSKFEHMDTLKELVEKCNEANPFVR